MDRLISLRHVRPLQLAGLGNPIRSDDSVGLYIASKLRRLVPSRAAGGFRILSPTATSELTLAKLDLMRGNALIFDAVECNREPGAIIAAELNDTKYGFFATHNVPMRIMPTLKSSEGSILLLGIEPESTEIGEKLTPKVKSSADNVVEALRERLEA